MTAKIKQLEDRLNDKKEQLLEKELVLEEISSLADRLRQQAAEGRSDTLELAKKVTPRTLQAPVLSPLNPKPLTLNPKP